MIKFAGDFSPFFNVYVKADKVWNKTETVAPGFAPAIPSDSSGSSSFNATGFKVVVKQPLYLWIGIGLTGIGLFGTVVNFMRGNGSKTTDKSGTSSVVKKTA
jgi:hypothetical protein